MTRIDRLARSVFELFAIVKRIIDAGGQFLSLAEPWADTSTGDGSVKRMVERLASLDQQPATTIHLRETSRGWRVDATPR
jgi:DNA invertase Pin-like site-specific DNA recombinase